MCARVWVLYYTNLRNGVYVCAYRVVYVIEVLAGGKGVVWVDAFESTDGQEHSDGRTERKEGLRMECQLGVVNGHLERRQGGKESERERELVGFINHVYIQPRENQDNRLEQPNRNRSHAKCQH
jgi:hypothetical protein